MHHKSSFLYLFCHKKLAIEAECEMKLKIYRETYTDIDIYPIKDEDLIFKEKRVMKDTGP